MLVEIFTPEALLFKGEVTSVKVPGAKGTFVILNHHAPIISLLTEGEVKLFGVNIFDYQWQETGEYVKVTDPLYHAERSFCLYKVVINGDTHSFVAGEFSNMIWGFYLLKY